MTVGGSASCAIEVDGLTVRYGDRTAVNGVSFSVDAGTVVALLGPNGAGKTSTVEVCEGFRRPDGGEVRVLGADPFEHSYGLAPHVGVMLQSGGVYPSARPGEILRLLASFAAAPLDIEALMRCLGLTAFAGTSYRRLSGGERQRLHLAMAIVGRPSVVFLDEPTAGMDIQARHTTWDLIRQLRSSGVAVLLTTHLLDEAELLADSVVILNGGKVAGSGSPAELTAATGISRLWIRSRPGLALGELQAGLPVSIQVSEPSPGEYLLDGVSLGHLGWAIGAITSWSRTHRATVTDLHTERRTLEDVFLALTTAQAQT